MWRNFEVTLCDLAEYFFLHYFQLVVVSLSLICGRFRQIVCVALFMGHKKCPLAITRDWLFIELIAHRVYSKIMRTAIITNEIEQKLGLDWPPQ